MDNFIADKRTGLKYELIVCVPRQTRNWLWRKTFVPPQPCRMQVRNQN